MERVSVPEPILFRPPVPSGVMVLASAVAKTTVFAPVSMVPPLTMPMRAERSVVVDGP